MKRLTHCCILLIFLMAMASSAAGIEYAIDCLEKGNPGGVAASLKTFDQKGGKDANKETVFDVWIKDVPEELITAGFWLSYDASTMSIVKIDVYDGTVVPGPWDSAMSKLTANPDSPGTHMVVAGNLGNVKPDKKGDVIIARVTCSCRGKCTKPIELTPIKDFDTVVGGNGKVFDTAIKPAVFTIQEK